jgi:hypothetical protein
VTDRAAGDTSTQAYSVQRANHTGTQLAATISDFDTAAVAAGSGTYLSDAVGSGLTQGARNPWTGKKLKVYGHSYATTGGSNYTAGGSFFELAGAALGMSVQTAQGYSGGRALDSALAVLGQITSPYAYTEDEQSAVVLDTVLNDAQFDTNPATANELQGFRHGLRACLAGLSQYRKIEDSDSLFTYGGAWNHYTGSVFFSNGDLSISPAGGSAGVYVEFVAPSETVYVMTRVTSPSETSNIGCVQEYLVDGTLRKKFNAASQMARYTQAGTGYTIDSGPAVVRLSGLEPGRSVVRIQPDQGGIGGSAAIIFDGIIIPAAQPARIVLVKDPTVGSGNAYQAAVAANLPLLHKALEDVAGEFRNVRIMNIGKTGWNTATMLWTDDTHLNDTGMAWAAGLLKEALRAP